MQGREVSKLILHLYFFDTIRVDFNHERYQRKYFFCTSLRIICVERYQS